MFFVQTPKIIKFAFQKKKIIVRFYSNKTELNWTSLVIDTCKWERYQRNNILFFLEIKIAIWMLSKQCILEFKNIANKLAITRIRDMM